MMCRGALNLQQNMTHATEIGTAPPMVEIGGARGGHIIRGGRDYYYFKHAAAMMHHL